MATYRQDDYHDMLNLPRQDMREGFAQQREAFDTRFDALDDKFDGVGSKIAGAGSKLDALVSKIERHNAEYAKQASEIKTERRLLIAIAIGVAIIAGITVSEFVVVSLPAIIRALQSGS